MKCPVCKTPMPVTDVVKIPDGPICRRRKCPKCGSICYTQETPVEYNSKFKYKWNEHYRKGEKNNAGKVSEDR